MRLGHLEYSLKTDRKKIEFQKMNSLEISIKITSFCCSIPKKMFYVHWIMIDVLFMAVFFAVIGYWNRKTLSSGKANFVKIRTFQFCNSRKISQRGLEPFQSIEYDYSNFGVSSYRCVCRVTESWKYKSQNRIRRNGKNIFKTILFWSYVTKKEWESSPTTTETFNVVGSSLSLFVNKR